MESVVLTRVGILGHLSETGSGFQTLNRTLYPNMGQVPPPPFCGCSSEGKGLKQFFFLDLV